jgi:hypothetical protein
MMTTLLAGLSVNPAVSLRENKLPMPISRCLEYLYTGIFTLGIPRMMMR